MKKKTPPPPQLTAAHYRICGKPVYEQDWQVLNLKSKFAEKGLCDGPAMSAGSACAYSCHYCYDEAMFAATAVGTALRNLGTNQGDVVIRRTNAVAKLKAALLYSNGQPRYKGSGQMGKVCYASPLVDVAATDLLAQETVEMVSLLLELTNWHVRLLSKSPLLESVATALEARHADAKKRLILGLSSGTLDAAMARAVEAGPPSVDQRLESSVGEV